MEYKFSFKGETLEKVIDLACDEINIDPEYLYYSVIKDGSEDNDWQIEAYTLTDVINFCSDYLERMITNIGLEGKATASLSEGVIKITLNTNHNSILIGKNGKTLQSMNEVVRGAAFQYFKKRYSILLDINDYKDDKYEKILRVAKRVAHEVQRTHIMAKLNPMTSDERRVIHNALSYMHNIKTESMGAGNNRRVCIYYIEEESKEEQ